MLTAFAHFRPLKPVRLEMSEPIKSCHYKSSSVCNKKICQIWVDRGWDSLTYKTVGFTKKEHLFYVSISQETSLLDS